MVDKSPSLAIDCGGVLTNNYTAHRYDGKEIYKATKEGAYAFVWLWIKKYGERSLTVVSRVNNPDNMRHWVVRHSESLGLNANDVSLYKDRREKGPIAKRLLVTHAIDDNSACVYVMARDAWTTLEVPLLFSSRPYEKQGCHDSWLKERLLVTDNFREVALHEKFGLEASEKVWNFLCEMTSASPP